MALLGDTLKYDKVDFQNLEAKLQNELWELSQAWSKYIRLILSFTIFISYLGIPVFWGLSNITEIS